MIKNKHILITGASRGLGKSLALKLHAQGARLSLVARDLRRLEALKNQLGTNVNVYGADLTDRSQVEQALQFFREQSGPLDVLINNAGTGWYKRQEEHSPDETRAIIELNLTSLVDLSQAVISDMKSAGSGIILNIASDLARKPLPNMSLYTATKHAVLGFSQSMARELKDDNIRVMCLNPGIIDTEFGGRDTGSVPPPHGLDPNDIADVAVFMLSRPAYLLMDEVTLHPMKQDF